MGSAGVKLNGGPAALRRARQRMFYEQHGRCHWCKRQMTLEARPGLPLPNYATWEHLINQCDGGSGRKENIRLACYRCNNKRARADALRRNSEAHHELLQDTLVQNERVTLQD